MFCCKNKSTVFSFARREKPKHLLPAAVNELNVKCANIVNLGEATGEFPSVSHKLPFYQAQMSDVAAEGKYILEKNKTAVAFSLDRGCFVLQMFLVSLFGT